MISSTFATKESSIKQLHKKFDFKLGSRRIFAIGDVHGCADELDALLTRLNLIKTDLVIFLGDYVDRGRNSRGVVDIILELANTCEVVALKGNHEELWLDFISQPGSRGAVLSVLNGGSATLASYSDGQNQVQIPDRHLEFYRNLYLSCETEGYFFVHAGLSPNTSIQTAVQSPTPAEMLWIREPFLNSQGSWGKVIVHGHTPTKQPEIKSNRINLDTGCVYDGNLTAIELPSLNITQVPKGTKNDPPVYLVEKYDQGQDRAFRFEGELPVMVAKVGEKSKWYKTINYNTFGMLIVDKIEGAPPPPQTFSLGDRIEGELQLSGEKLSAFTGEITRVDLRPQQNLYGIKLLWMESLSQWPNLNEHITEKI